MRGKLSIYSSYYKKEGVQANIFIFTIESLGVEKQRQELAGDTGHFSMIK